MFGFVFEIIGQWRGEARQVSERLSGEGTYDGRVCTCI